MKFIENIRIAAGRYFLQKEKNIVFGKRNVPNIKTAKTIGIIYEALDQETYNAVTDMAESLREKGKIVKIMGYIPSRKYAQDYYLKLEFDFFNWKDLNWRMKPTKNTVIDFINNDFDILIDLSLKPCFALEYIVHTSKANFKVGRFVSENKLNYDLMIHNDEHNSLRNFISIIVHYLTIINSGIST